MLLDGAAYGDGEADGELNDGDGVADGAERESGEFCANAGALASNMAQAPANRRCFMACLRERSTAKVSFGCGQNRPSCWQNVPGRGMVPPWNLPSGQRGFRNP